jgi:hypothetical protein
VDSNDLYEDVLTQAAAQARRYLRTIRERHAGVLPEAIKGLSVLGGPLPARGENPLAILKLLDDAGSPATVASMGGAFFRRRNWRRFACQRSGSLAGRCLGSKCLSV